MVWFNHAPLLVFIKEAFDLTSQQVKALMILNVALTIPARILIGILVDKIGPRKVYSAPAGNLRFSLCRLCLFPDLSTVSADEIFNGLCRCRFCYWYSYGRRVVSPQDQSALPRVFMAVGVTLVPRHRRCFCRPLRCSMGVKMAGAMR